MSHHVNTTVHVFSLYWLLMIGFCVYFSHCDILRHVNTRIKGKWLQMVTDIDEV